MSEAKQAPTMADIVARIEALEAYVAEKRNRGPASTRSMTDQDAFDVKFGKMADLEHNEAAEALGLSYGQVYSCRNGYTKKHVKSDWKPK